MLTKQEIIIQSLVLKRFFTTQQEIIIQPLLYCTFRQHNRNNNTVIGENALSDNSTGSANTAIGFNTLTTNTTGSENTAVDYLLMLLHQPDKCYCYRCNAVVNASNKVRIGNSNVTLLKDRLTGRLAVTYG